MTYRTIDIIAAFEAEERAGTKVEELDAVIKSKFPGITAEECLHALDVMDFDAIETLVKFRRAKAQREEAFHLFEGLDDTVTLGEAIKLKAEQGDLVALRWQAGMNTRDFRLAEALGLAARAAHPQWKETSNDRWQWIGEDEMPSEDAMIDWFQMNYPTVARRIEDEIDNQQNATATQDTRSAP